MVIREYEMETAGPLECIGMPRVTEMLRIQRRLSKVGQCDMQLSGVQTLSVGGVASSCWRRTILRREVA